MCKRAAPEIVNQRAAIYMNESAAATMKLNMQQSEVEEFNPIRN